MKPEAPKYNFRNIKTLKFGEEVGNSISHGVPALFILLTLPYFSIKTYIEHNAIYAFGISVFLISIFLMFLSSSIYHLMPPHSTHKYVMRIIDHAMIYIAIAGTYTPIALSLVGGTLGWTIMMIEWIVTIGGIVYKSVAINVNPKISLSLYLVMGWLGILLFPTLVNKAIWYFIAFILLGGIMYSVGAWFYAQKHRHYFHMIWHFFILAGATCHFVALLYFIH